MRAFATFGTLRRQIDILQSEKASLIVEKMRLIKEREETNRNLIRVFVQTTKIDEFLYEISRISENDPVQISLPPSYLRENLLKDRNMLLDWIASSLKSARMRTVKRTEPLCNIPTSAESEVESEEEISFEEVLANIESFD